MSMDQNYQGHVLPSAGCDARVNVRQRELPTLAQVLENTIADTEASVASLFDRLGPVRMAVPASSSQGCSSLPHGGSSPLGGDLAGCINRLRPLINSVNSVAEELAV